MVKTKNELYDREEISGIILAGAGYESRIKAFELLTDLTRLYQNYSVYDKYKNKFDDFSISVEICNRNVELQLKFTTMQLEYKIFIGSIYITMAIMHNGIKIKDSGKASISDIESSILKYLRN